MIYTTKYDSPLGEILLAADEIGMRGLWFFGQKYFALDLPTERARRETSVLSESKCWLDVYFSGKEPDFVPPLNSVPSPFRRAVWDILTDSIRKNRHVRRYFETTRAKKRS